MLIADSEGELYSLRTQKTYPFPDETSGENDEFDMLLPALASSV
jgi:hypothetical protein